MGTRRAADPETQYFRYLNRLRAGGRTNMYGAVPYLMRTFGLERGPAFDVVCRWVDAYDALVEQGAEGQIVVRPGPPAARHSAAKSSPPVVVHRPRRASRARPPKNRKPVPDVQIRIPKAAGARRKPDPKPKRPPKPARR